MSLACCDGCTLTAEHYNESIEQFRLAHKARARRDGSVLLLPFDTVDQSRGEQRGTGSNAGYDQQTTSELL
jgi:hypothetical protein